MIHRDRYEEAYISLFSKILEITKEAVGEANSISEGSIRLAPSDDVPAPHQRDVEVILGFVNGYTCEEIASKIKRSPRTIETLLAGMRKKYGVNSTYQLIGVLFRNGWIK